MIQFAQIGDVHLGSPLLPVGTMSSSKRRSRLLLSFEEAIAKISENGVDVCFLPGDLFDSNQVTPATVQGAISALSKAAGVLFFIAPGNHDYFCEYSPFFYVKWPKNVHVFTDSAITFVDVPRLNLRVYGKAGNKYGQSEEVLDGFFVQDKEKINILVLHALVAGTSVEDYYRITASQIAASGLDYLALGHIHSFGGLQRAEGTYYAYSGCLEGRGFDETGEKGFLMGRLEKKDVELDLIPWGKVRFETGNVIISNCGSQSDVIDAVRGFLARVAFDAVVRITLTGNTDLELNCDLLAETCGRENLQIIDETVHKIDFEALSKEQSLTGFFVKRMLARMEGANETEQERIRQACQMGLVALSGRSVISDEI